MQNQLFEYTLPDRSIFALDLLAVNLNRGRDHGLQTHAKYYQRCTGRAPTSYADFPLNNGKRQALQRLYPNLNDADFYAGGLNENKVNGGVTGTTFACIINEQFRDLKNGDRFYYENSGSTAFTLVIIGEKIYLRTFVFTFFRFFEIG
jgi:hypothetical protein